jgi:hypothetical protein
MVLRTKGEFSYGDAQTDIREELARYSKANAYPVHHFADAVCKCGSRLFVLSVDDTEGAAIRHCDDCEDEHPIGDSEEYLEDADLEGCECPCGSDVLEITVGVSLYAESQDVRWLYIGCRCRDCGLTACYGDWKNEYIGYQELLDRI